MSLGVGCLIAAAIGATIYSKAVWKRIDGEMLAFFAWFLVLVFAVVVIGFENCAVENIPVHCGCHVVE